MVGGPFSQTEPELDKLARWLTDNEDAWKGKSGTPVDVAIEIMSSVSQLEDKLLDAADRAASSRDSIVSLRHRLKAARDERHQLKAELAQAQLQLEYAQQRQIGMLLMGQAIVSTVGGDQPPVQKGSAAGV